MNKVKVFWHGKRLKDMYVGATRFEIFKFKTKRIIRRSMITGFVIQALGWTAVAGYNYAKNNIAPQIVEAQKIVEVPVQAPVLDRIIQCESGGKHYGSNGQVLVNINVQSDGTKSIDVGLGQINISIWGKIASKMGYDLMREKDNLEFTRFLFSQYGSEPWVWSKKCWNK